MALAVDRDFSRTRVRFLRSPVFWLAAVIAVLPLFLILPLSIPIGPMYWDLFIYFDAANRIFHGQVPVIDFFVPVGPLGYYLFAGGLKLFPGAQPLLLVDWSLLAVTGPLMAIVLWHVGSRSRTAAFALLLPFLFFALLPFNTRDYYPYPGSDGFGIYNRQVCQVLYVLVSGLVFLRGQRALAIVVTVAMAALCFLKITGFVAAFLLCLFAFLSGRLTLRYAVGSALAFFALLGVLEIADGMASQYAIAIWELLNKNSDTLLPRLLQAASHTFGVVAPGGLLALFILWCDRIRLQERWRAMRVERTAASAARLVDHDALWLLLALFAGIFFESQNTGSQAMIFVWPVVLAILMARKPLLAHEPRSFLILAVLAGMAVLPPIVNTAERAARTYVGATKNLPLESDNLKTLGRVSARPDIMARAEKMIEFYPRHRATYADFVRIGELPGYIYYSEFAFQLVHLMAMDRAIAAIRALEAEKNIHFDSMMELNFVDPFPYLMNRKSPKYVAIGADPSRAVPTPGSQEENAVRGTDLVLYPTCPLTTANDALFKLYAPALEDHVKIRLDRCFDAYVNPRFVQKFRR